MNKFLFKVIFLLISFNSNAQLQIINDVYNTFDGRSINVHLIQGRYTAVCFDTSRITSSQLKDTSTLKLIVAQIDSMYSFYKNFFGREPSGGWSKYGNKSAVAFVPPSCGAACGLVGSKGVEIDPGMLTQILNEQKYPVKTYRVGIVSYEFGRNFFTFGSKILFPVNTSLDQRNGGFAEGFASFASVYEFIDQGGRKPTGYLDFQETNLNYDWLVNSFRAYIIDPNASPDSNLQKDKFIFDINRSYYGNYYGVYAGPIIYGTYDIFKNQLNWPEFFNYLSGAPNSNTKEIAMGNLALAFSRATKLNLNSYFKNVLKFQYDAQFENSIKTFPKPSNRLIKDKSTLYFTDITDTILLNIKSINHQIDQLVEYHIFIDGLEYSRSNNGINSLSYAQIAKKDSLNINVYLLDNGIRVDSQNIVIKKRKTVRLSEYKDQLFFSSARGTSIPTYNNGTYIIESVSNDESYPLYELIFPVKRNQRYRLSASIATNPTISNENQDSNGDGVIDYWARMSIGGGGGLDGTSRVGYDVKVRDTTFYSATSLINTNSYFNEGNRSWSGNLKYMIQKVYLEAVGVGRYKFKDVEVNNITDTDSDGIIDFEDQCNYGENSVKPIFNTTNFNFCNGDTLKLSVNNLKQNEKLIWYYGGKVDSTNKLSLNVTDSMKIFVLKKDSIGCSRFSDTIQIKKYSIPSAPTLSRDTANFLLSGVPGTTWYKDGSAITDTTQKYKPLTPGSYTAKTTTNGCTSVMSAAYYYLVTDIINLSKDEFIKLAPNPFINQLNFDFIVKGYQKLNIEVYDLATGSKVASQQNLTAGSRINLGQLSAGTYVIRVTSTDNKISYHFKMVKL